MDTHSSFRTLFIGLLFLLWITRLPVQRYLSPASFFRALRHDAWDCLVFFLTAGLMTAGTFVYLAWPEWIAWGQGDPPAWLRASGATVCVAALAFLRWADHTLGENLSVALEIKPHHRLVTEGPYRYVRHPIYGAGLIFVVGLALVSAHLVPACGLVGGMVLLVTWRIPREEALLRRAFGEQYVAYSRETPRLIPRIGCLLSASRSWLIPFAALSFRRDPRPNEDTTPRKRSVDARHDGSGASDEASTEVTADSGI